MTNIDVSILTVKKDKKLIIVDIYVNDLALESRSIDILKWLKDQLIKEFSMKDLGEAKTIIK